MAFHHAANTLPKLNSSYIVGDFMSHHDVLTIGNAIVDIIARTEDDFLKENGIIKAAMNLVDADRAKLLYSRMAQAIETSGGSAANTACGIASLGGKAAFFGKVANDQLGEIFTHDIRAQGVTFNTEPLIGSSPTARSMIFVTPDGERSMNTYLGASIELGPEDIDKEIIAEAKVTYFEGYLWDPPKAKEAIRLAAEIAHQNGRKTALTLSDSFCVDRYHDEFLDLLQNKKVDIVFANSDEAKALYKTDNLETALAGLRAACELAAVTCAGDGAIIISGDETIAHDALEIPALVDTTGAGDLYAAGFLTGYTKGLDLLTCGKLGALSAGVIVGQVGPRPMVSLKQLAVQNGLLRD